MERFLKRDKPTSAFGGGSRAKADRPQHEAQQRGGSKNKKARLGDQKKEGRERSAAEQEPPEREEEPTSSVPSSSRQQRESWSTELKEKYGIPFGDEFFDLWDVARALNPEAPLQAFRSSIGVDLVGPFDVLAGKFQSATVEAAQFHGMWLFLRYSKAPACPHLAVPVLSAQQCIGATSSTRQRFSPSSPPDR